MKEKMALNEVWEYYGRSDIIQTCEGFELKDELRDFTMVIPHEFYRFLDGELIDLTTMLVDRTGWMKRELLKGLDLCTPVSLMYAFGRFVLDYGHDKFYIQDPMKSTADSMDILIEAEWDLRQGVSNMGWIPEVEKNWKGLVYYQKTISKDAYETKGKQIWILHASTSMPEIMKLKTDFYTGQRRLIEVSNEALQKFETEKERYRKQIVESLEGGLPERVHWIVAAEEEELWPKYDANQELWVNKESDWQIIVFNDRLEIRSRGGSPGEISLRRLRYDMTGLHLCQELVKTAKSSV